MGLFTTRTPETVASVTRNRERTERRQAAKLEDIANGTKQRGWRRRSI